MPTENCKRATGWPIVKSFRPWRTTGNTKRSAGPSAAEVDRRPTGPPTPVPQNLDRGMRPTKNFQSVPQKDSNTRTRGVQKTIVTPLSALAENFIPRKTSRKPPTPQMPTDNELDRSFVRTGLGKIETPQDVIEIDIATVGAAYPTEIGKPVAVADVAGASGPAATRAGGPVVAGARFLAATDSAGAGGLAVTRTGGPVVTGTRFRSVTDVAGAGGLAVTEAGGPVVAGTRFLAVAEVYALFEETEGDPQGDDRKVDQNSNTPEEDAGSRPLEHSGVKEGGRPEYGMNEFDCTAQEEEIISHPLEHSGVVEWAGVSDGLKKRSPPESFEIRTDPAPVRKALEEEPIEHSAPSGTPNGGSKPLNTDVQEETEDGEAIIVGAVGSAAPWFLTGWTNEVEVEFMIDTGCQVRILATSVFEKMCTAHPQVRSRIRPCTRRLVSADSSPLTVIGKIDLDVVFPGLKCSMCCVLASIGSDGLLGKEALQSCLPHQLDLRTGLLWAEGRSTLQLHQQKPTPDVRGLLLTAVVLPPDSEVVAPFSLNGGQLGSCAFIVPDRDLTEVVVVRHTLVDASVSSANVLIINPNAEEVVLPCRTSIGQLVLISAV